MSARWLAKELSKKDSTLIGFWPLFESFVDYSGKGNHARPAPAGLTDGTLTPFLRRIAGKTCYSFTYGYYLDCLNSTDLSFSYLDKFSIMCSFYKLGNSAGGLISKTDGDFAANFKGYELYHDGVATIYFRLVNNFSGNNYLSVSYTFDSREINFEWTHIAATYDGSGLASGVKLYINGRPVNAAIDRDTLTGEITHTNTFQIGATRRSTGVIGVNGFGAIGQTRVYRRNLSPNDISTIYQNLPKAETWESLRVSNLAVSNNTSLFIAAAEEFTIETSLYIDGTSADSNCYNMTSLYMQGVIESSGNIPLFLEAQPNSRNYIPLFIGGPLSPASGASPLFMFGAGQSGQYNTMPVVISGEFNGGSVPLYIRGPDSDGKNTNFPVFLRGEYPTVNNSTSLYIAGPSGTTKGTSLYIEVEGQTIGGLPHSGAIPLFLRRHPAFACPLFIAVGTPGSVDRSLYIKGATQTTGAIPIVIPTVVGTNTKQTNVFTRGI